MTDFLSQLSNAQKNKFQLSAKVFQCETNALEYSEKNTCERDTNNAPNESLYYLFKKQTDGLSQHADKLIATYYTNLVKNEVNNDCKVEEVSETNSIATTQFDNRIHEKSQVKQLLCTTDSDIICAGMDIEQCNDNTEKEQVEETAVSEDNNSTIFGEMDFYFKNVKGINMKPLDMLEGQIFQTDLQEIDYNDYPIPIPMEQQEFTAASTKFQTAVPTYRNHIRTSSDQTESLQNQQMTEVYCSKNINKNSLKPFKFKQLVNQMEQSKVLLEIFELDDPSKIMFTLTRGIINLLELASQGKFSNIFSWGEIKKEFLQHEKIIKELRDFEKIAKHKKFNEQQVMTMRSQYQYSTEIQIVLNSTKRHFAADLLEFLLDGILYLQHILDNKTKPLNSTQHFRSSSNYTTLSEAKSRNEKYVSSKSKIDSSSSFISTTCNTENALLTQIYQNSRVVKIMRQQQLMQDNSVERGITQLTSIEKSKTNCVTIRHNKSPFNNQLYQTQPIQENKTPFKKVLIKLPAQKNMSNSRNSQPKIFSKSLKQDKENIQYDKISLNSNQRASQIKLGKHLRTLTPDNMKRVENIAIKTQPIITNGHKRRSSLTINSTSSQMLYYPVLNNINHNKSPIIEKKEFQVTNDSSFISSQATLRQKKGFCTKQQAQQISRQPINKSRAITQEKKVVNYQPLLKQNPMTQQSFLQTKVITTQNKKKTNLHNKQGPKVKNKKNDQTSWLQNQIQKDKLKLEMTIKSYSRVQNQINLPLNNRTQDTLIRNT